MGLSIVVVEKLKQVDFNDNTHSHHLILPLAAILPNEKQSSCQLE
jgi:hypothetical protein